MAERSLTVFPSGRNQIDLYWDPPDDPVFGYEIKVFDVGNYSYEHLVPNTNGTGTS